MDLEREAAAEFGEEVISEEFEPKQADAGIGTAPGYRLSDLLPDMSFLLSRTGDGAVDDYIDHPLNFKMSQGIAQIIRGLTGIAGELNYAVIDIALGAINYTKEGKEQPKNETDYGE